jgi:hypothetical protein
MTDALVCRQVLEIRDVDATALSLRPALIGLPRHSI